MSFPVRRPSTFLPVLLSVLCAAAPAARAAHVAPAGKRQSLRACANRARAAHHLSFLHDDPALDRAAQKHAADMQRRSYFDHNTPAGRTPWDRIRAALGGEHPFTSMGENIAEGYSNGADTCTAWLHSPDHRRNILDPHFDRIGTGWAGGYAVQDFGGR